MLGSSQISRSPFSLTLFSKPTLYHRAFAKPRDGVTKEGTMIYFARKQDCGACALKPKCCPNVPARKIARSIHEAARDKARAIAKTEAYAVSCRERKKV
jgi:hypothetical protein